MKIQVDLTKCQGYANCVIEAPDVFELGEQSHKVFVRIVEPDATLHGEVRSAAEACPMHAIALVQ